jgi:hypothetical protein
MESCEEESKGRDHGARRGGGACSRVVCPGETPCARRLPLPRTFPALALPFPATANQATINQQINHPPGQN